MTRFLILAVLPLFIASCGEHYMCPRVAELVDIIDRCNSFGDRKACDVLANLTEDCLRCRKLQLIEPNEAMRRAENCL